MVSPFAARFDSSLFFFHSILVPAIAFSAGDQSDSTICCAECVCVVCLMRNISRSQRRCPAMRVKCLFSSREHWAGTFGSCRKKCHFCRRARSERSLMDHKRQKQQHCCSDRQSIGLSAKWLWLIWHNIRVLLQWTAEHWFDVAGGDRQVMCGQSRAILI